LVNFGKLDFLVNFSTTFSIFDLEIINICKSEISEKTNVSLYLKKIFKDKGLK
jgi:hypothetical protein